MSVLGDERWFKCTHINILSKVDLFYASVSCSAGLQVILVYSFLVISDLGMVKLVFVRLTIYRMI